MSLLALQSLLTVACTVCSRHIQISKLNNVQKKWRNREESAGSGCNCCCYYCAGATSAKLAKFKTQSQQTEQDCMAKEHTIATTHTHTHTYTFYVCLPHLAVVLVVAVAMQTSLCVVWHLCCQLGTTTKHLTKSHHDEIHVHTHQSI